MSQACGGGWCECDGRAVGEGDYWAGVGRQVQGRQTGLGNDREGFALLCLQSLHPGWVALLCGLPCACRSLHPSPVPASERLNYY